MHCDLSLAALGTVVTNTGFETRVMVSVSEQKVSTAFGRDVTLGGHSGAFLS